MLDRVNRNINTQALSVCDSFAEARRMTGPNELHYAVLVQNPRITEIQKTLNEISYMIFMQRWEEFLDEVHPMNLESSIDRYEGSVVRDMVGLWIDMFRNIPGHHHYLLFAANKHTRRLHVDEVANFIAILGALPGTLYMTDRETGLPLVLPHAPSYESDIGVLRSIPANTALFTAYKGNAGLVHQSPKARRMVLANEIK